MISRAVSFEDLQNGYTWNKHVFTGTNANELNEFLKSKVKIVGTDKNFNVPLCVDYIGQDCILIHKDGTKTLSKFEHIYKRNAFYFETEESYKTFAQVKKSISKIIFMDEFKYHESFREYWSENGFSGKVYQHKQQFLNSVLGELCE